MATNDRLIVALQALCDNEKDKGAEDGLACEAAWCMLRHLREAGKLPRPIPPLWQGLISYALEWDDMENDALPQRTDS